MLQILDDFAKLNNILMNINKTKLMVITRPGLQVSLTYNNMLYELTSINNKESIRFLGVWFSLDKKNRHIYS